MHRLKKFHCVAFAVIVLVALAPLYSAQPAMASSLTETVTTDYGARVNYEYVVSECLVRRVFISATTNQGGQLFVNVQDFDPCTGEESPDARTAFTSLNSQAFKIKPDLSKARLNATVMACFSDEFACIPVDINLRWRAAGPVEQREFPGQFCDPDFDGTLFVMVQPAAVKGSVKIDGQQTFSGDYFAEMDAQTTVCP
jgi:hypothetical protein